MIKCIHHIASLCQQVQSCTSSQSLVVKCLHMYNNSMHNGILHFTILSLYVCRTGNITLRYQYGGVQNVVVVLWSIGTETTTTNPSTISGHTALPLTTTYRHDFPLRCHVNIFATQHAAGLGTTACSFSTAVLRKCVYVEGVQYWSS